MIINERLFVEDDSLKDASAKMLTTAKYMFVLAALQMLSTYLLITHHFAGIKSYLKSFRYFWEGYLNVLRNKELHAKKISYLMCSGYDYNDAVVVVGICLSLQELHPELNEKELLHEARMKFKTFLRKRESV